MEALIEVRHAQGTQSFRCSPGESFLNAALRAGVDVAYGCATGTCGKCKASVLAGSIERVWDAAPGRRALRRPDEILLCQSRPQGNCVLEARRSSCNHPRERAQSYQGHLAAVDLDGDGLAWVVLKLDRPMRFHAGQFVLVSIQGIEGFRAYSPAHDGANVTELAFVVRQKEEGALSPLLCTKGRVGTRVEVFGPLGTAHVHPAEDQDLAILVGGSGSGVALSLLDWAVGSGHLTRNRMDIICGLRTLRSQQVIERFAGLADAAPGRLRIVVALSEPGESDAPTGQPGLRFEPGMAHEVASRILSADEWNKRAVFVAGPAPMVEASLRMLMLTAKLSPTKIRYDSFA